MTHSTQSEILRRTCVVLNRPIYPRNIGMCARAMGNLGCADLRIIAPQRPWDDQTTQHEARQGATHAGPILNQARLYSSQSEFLETAGQGVRIAFSAREGTGRRILDFAEMLQLVLLDPQHPIRNSGTLVQLHFGAEDDGLSLEELESMSFICRLPAKTSFTSFNLSHAVLLALHILESTRPHTSASDFAAANAAPTLSEGRLEHPRRAIREWLEALGFDLDSRRISIETSLNRVLLSHCPSPDDVRLLEKVLFQTVEKLKSKKDQAVP